MSAASHETQPPMQLHEAPTGDEPDGDGIGTALALLQNLVNQEISRAERAAARARQAFALSAGFFAVVQTVAFGSFAKAQISGHERITLLWIAGGAGVLLAICGALLLIADGAFKSYNLTTETILSVLNEDDANGLTSDERFVQKLSGVVRELRSTNARRQIVVLITQAAAFAAIMTVLAELIYSLDARLS